MYIFFIIFENEVHIKSKNNSTNQFPSSFTQRYLWVHVILENLCFLRKNHPLYVSLYKVTVIKSVATLVLELPGDLPHFKTLLQTHAFGEIQY